MFGQQNQVSRQNEVQISEKSWWVTLILLWLFPWLGIYAFYLGDKKKGLIWLFTAGCFFVGVFMDFFKLLNGELKDAKGAFVKKR